GARPLRFDRRGAPTVTYRGSCRRVRRRVLSAPPPKAQLPQSLRQKGLRGRNSHLESGRAVTAAAHRRGTRRAEKNVRRAAISQVKGTDGRRDDRFALFCSYGSPACKNRHRFTPCTAPRARAWWISAGGTCP